MKNLQNPKSQGYRMPAEWEKHEATWLSWPKDPITWPDRVNAAQEVFCQMISALTPHEKVHLLVDSEEVELELKQKFASRDIVMPSLIFHRLKTVDSWIRDYGPNFIVKESKGKKTLAYNHWIFNAWGNKYESLKQDNAIPAQLQNYLKLEMFEPGIVLEGGSIDVNGCGSLLTTEQCLLNHNRNPQLTKIEIEEILKHQLGVEQILWLGEGIAGDDTDGHIDDITRFVSENTIVTVIEEDKQDPNYQPLQDNLKRLKLMKNLDGKPFEIVTLPMPGAVESDEGRLPASYGNFYIANNVVLVPIFKHAHDELALTTLQKLFPKRKVIGIDCRDLVWGMGAIHCVTQQQPY